MEPSKRAVDKDQDDIMAVNPRAINVAEFAAARATELKTMTEAVMTMGGMRRTFQMLPRHLRRRAMSHDLRRLPKRLRDSEERAMLRSAGKRKSAPTTKSGDEEVIPAKRSRRHRRRPGNLKQEYQRRQRNNAWLETHIWHAKRFKMVEAWGLRLPLHPTDRGVRAAYRATARHCTIQDISFFQVIEIFGPQAMILRALSHLTSPLTGLTCGATSFIKGQHHGETIFYQTDLFPDGAIGPVSFLWKADPRHLASKTEETFEKAANKLAPSCKDSSRDGKIRQLWLWSHPSCLDLLVKELQTASLKVTNDGEFTGSIVVRKIEPSPVRFRLQGPLSHPVLLDALKAADVSSISTNPGEPGLWWEDYYASPDNMQAFSEQSAAWESLHGILSSTDIPSRSVLALTVRDPRNLLPIKKTKIMVDSNEVHLAEQLPSNVTQGFNAATTAVSPIFEELVRQSVTSTQMSIHELNKLRSELLVPGQELQLGRRESRIPVLLLHQPGVQPSAAGQCASSEGSCPVGFGSGWDIVVPSGWGMAFWIALVFRGARATGLQQSRSCHLQQGIFHFPEAFPDTKSGKEWEDRIEQELTDKYRRWPPAKRPNYGKLGVVSPFRCPWLKLLQEWKDSSTQDENSKHAPTSDTDSLSKASEDVQSFFVLREKYKLEELNKAMTSGKKPLKETKPAKGGNWIGLSDARECASDETVKASNGRAVQTLDSSTTASKRNHQQWLASDISFTSQMHVGAARTIVAVKLRMANRGVPEKLAMVCIPSDEDVAAFTSNSRYSPVEPIHKEFKLPRRSKQKKKKRKKGKSADRNPRELVEEQTSSVKFEVSPHKDLFESCTRKVIGFVCDGANVFVSGSGQAVGFCCMLGLLHLIQERPQVTRSLVLIRNANTVQYRFAYLKIIC